MGAKMGRPLSGDKPLVHDIKVRGDEDTHAKLTEYSIEQGITVAESVRRSISLMLSEKKK